MSEPDDAKEASHQPSDNAEICVSPHEADQASKQSDKTTEHLLHPEDLHSYLIRSWNELSPEERANNLTLSTQTGNEAARTIVVLLLLDSLSHLLASDIAKAQSLIFPVLYYFSLAEIIPGLIAQVLEAKLRDIGDMLEGEGGGLPEWLVLSGDVKEETVRVVRSWVERMAKAEEGGSVAEVRKAVVRRLREEDGGGRHCPPRGCEKEVEFHRHFGVLTMNWASHELFYEEELRRAYGDFDPTHPALTSEEFLEVVDAEWRVNPAFVRDLVDFADSPPSEAGLIYNCGHTPASFTQEIIDRGAKAPEDQGMMEYVSYWFNGVAHAIAGLRQAMKVEVTLSKP